MFREQVATVSNWFDRWTPCEQTVAMVALLRRLQPTQAKFLTSVIQRQLADCNELRRSEILANDPTFVASLATSESKEALVRELMAHLPLLNPKSNDVKGLYLALIPKVLKYTLDNCSMMEEARQLLSYSLIHPAFTIEDRGMFSQFLHQFEEKLSSTPTNIPSNEGINQHYSSSISGSPPGSGNEFSAWQQGNSPSNLNSSSLSNSPSQGGLIIGNFGNNNFQRIRRSNSLTPPVLHSDAWNSQEELYSSFKPRSLSLSSEVSPQSSLASSGSNSESHLDDSKPTFTNPGMKDVPAWLKSLRLHKYSALFAHITFEEMMELTEEGLEAQGVTKGARHKIVLSIGKLKERVAHLKTIYDEMTSDRDSIRNALSEVKWVLTTPIKPTGETEEASTPTHGNKSSSENANGMPSAIGPIGSHRFQDENKHADNSGSEWHTVSQPPVGERSLTSWIVRVVGKACELNPEIEGDGLLVSVLDKCLSHDAFTFKQKRLLSLWRQQQAPVRRNSFGQYGHFHSHCNRRGSGSPGCGMSCGANKHNRHMGPRGISTGHSSTTQNSTPHSWSPSSSIHAMFMAKRPSLQDSILESIRSQHSVQRTKSAPIPNFLSSLSCSPPSGNLYEQMSSGVGTMQPSSGSLNGSSLHGKLDFGPIGLLGPSSTSSGPGSSSTVTSTNVPAPGMTSSFGQTTTTSTAMDITSRLESLCLSMTEAALGPAFNSY